MHQGSRGLTTAFAIVLLCLGEMAGAEVFSLPWHTIDGGGMMFGTGGAFSLSGTIGQSDAWTMAGGDFELVGGFWAASGTSGFAPGDCDYDGDVDLDDYAGFADCLGGPGVEVGAVCDCTDFNADTAVDLLDFAAFQRAYGQ